MSAIYECECDSFEMYEEQDSFEMAEAVPGLGVPSGGLTGQVLKKRSDEDFDTEWADESGGGGGTSDYTQLSNKPQINGNTLAGNKTGTDLGLVNAVPGKQLSTEDYTAEEKTKLSGIEAQANKTVIDSTLTNAGQAADAKKTGDELTDLRNTLTQLGAEVDAVENGIAVVVDGNKTINSNGAASGEFVLVKNSTITDIVDGVYTASKTIPANTVIDKTYFNLDGDGKSTVNKGALNLLNTKTISKTKYHSIQTPQIAPGNTATVAFSYPSGVDANNLISWSVIGCIPDSTNTAYAFVTYFDGTNFTVVAQGSGVQSYRIRLAFFYHD